MGVDDSQTLTKIDPNKLPSNLVDDVEHVTL